MPDAHSSVGTAPPTLTRVSSGAGAPSLCWRDRLALRIQRAVGRCLAPLYAPLVVALLRGVMRYRIHNLSSVRRRFREILCEDGSPLLICPNHLTMIDSAIVAWALASPWRYALEYRLLPWNTPESNNFSNPLVRAFCYVAKCLPIHRGGDRRRQQIVLEKVADLLRRGDLALMFPEGRRSRTGVIDLDAMGVGVGRILKKVPGARVLCVYVRGDGQGGYSTMPKRGERFTVELRVIRPSGEGYGLRASRALTSNILGELSAMERAYHARRQ